MPRADPPWTPPLPAPPRPSPPPPPPPPPHKGGTGQGNGGGAGGDEREATGERAPTRAALGVPLGSKRGTQGKVRGPAEPDCGHGSGTGVEMVVAFTSRSCNDAEANYPSYAEGLAVVWAVKHFRVYLQGRQFTLMTDHQPLLWLMQTSDLTGMNVGGY
ncbi:unnamed protein product [Closterium sp. NIES-54]